MFPEQIAYAGGNTVGVTASAEGLGGCPPGGIGKGKGEPATSVKLPLLTARTETAPGTEPVPASATKRSFPAESITMATGTTGMPPTGFKPVIVPDPNFPSDATGNTCNPVALSGTVEFCRTNTYA